MLKRCFRCKEYKELAEYHKDKSGKFGVRNLCKNCALETYKEFYLIHEHPRNSLAVNKKYYQSEKGKTATNAASRRAAKKFPEKWAARSKLRYHVKLGEIIKPVMCDKYNPHPEMPCYGKIEGHHYLGYEGEHWKDVMWLCKRHHVSEHYNIELTKDQS